MYNVSSAFTQQAFSPNRTLYVKVEIGTAIIQDTDIISMSVEESCCADNITIGSTNSQILKITFHKPSTLAIQGAIFKPYISFDNTEWCPLGVFKATDCIQQRDDVYEVVGYDALAFLDEEYSPTITPPTTANLILTDICVQYGLTFSGTMPTTTITDLYEGSVRDTIGYMAGLVGKNAVINRDGNLEFRWFTPIPNSPTNAIMGTAILGQAIVGDSGTSISADLYYENELKTSGQMTISALVSGGETQITSGSGNAITFYNPYMTQTILDNIVANNLPITYYGVGVKYRCNPAYEVGDIALVEELSTPIMHNTIYYDGGLYADIESFAPSEEKVSVSQINPVKKEINRVTEAIQQEISQMSDDVLAGRNGYVVDVVQDLSGTLSRVAIRAMDTPTLTPTTRGVEFNSNGIAYSTNGFTTFSKTILDMANGKLYADDIVANTVLSNKITAQDLDITGGSIKITTSAQDYDQIELSYNSYKSSMRATGFVATNGIFTSSILYGGFSGPSAIITGSGDAALWLSNSGGILSGQIMPTTSNTYQIGSSSNYWSGVVANNFMVMTTTTTTNAYCGFSASGYLQKYGSSSRKYKKDEKKISKELKEKFNKLYDLEIKSWKYKDGYLGEEDELNGKETFGLIAEDIGEILPEAITHNLDGTIDNYRDRNLLNAMLYLLQEQHKEIQELKARLE